MLSGSFVKVEQMLFVDLSIPKTNDIELIFFAFRTETILSKNIQSRFLSYLRALSEKAALVIILLPSKKACDFAEEAQFFLELHSFSKNTGSLIYSEAFLQQAINRESIFDIRMEYYARCPYSLEFQKILAEYLEHVRRCRLSLKQKLLVVDLDNTLWGGAWAENEGEKIELGGHSPVGESYRDVQVVLRNAAKDGYMLAICSKNNKNETLAFINSHGEMLLKESDFSCISISWENKAIQIQKILDATKHAPEHVCFFDDSAHERDLVKSAFPGMLVPELPDDPLMRPIFLRRIIGLDQPFRSAEDSIRTNSHMINSRREKLRVDVQTEKEWLEALNAELTVTLLDSKDVLRASQLLNRANQFHLTMSRYGETKLRSWLGLDGHELYQFRYVDRLGDDGVIGLVAMEFDTDRLVISEFVLSCRAFGRTVEKKMLEFCLKKAQVIGQKEIFFRANNNLMGKVAKDFLREISAKQTDEHLYKLGIESYVPYSPIKLLRSSKR
jgi:FkbH-like protein